MKFRLTIIGFTIICLSTCGTITAQNAKYPLNPKAADYNVQLGLGYLQQKDMERAKAKLLLALQQAPKWSVAHDAMAYYLEITGDQQQAESFYKKALSLDRHSGSALNNYGTFLCRQERFKEAQKYFLAATKESSYLNTADAYENAGLCATIAQDFVGAERYFRKALAQDSRRPTSNLELAKLSFIKGNFRESTKYLDRYLSLYPADAQSDVLKAQLSSKFQHTQKMTLS